MGHTVAYPLYPTAGQQRLGPEKVARLYGPIASVDGEKVATKGNTFELLPGCHVVHMQHNVGEGGWDGSWAATFGNVVFAFEMKAGHAYSIEVETDDNSGPIGRAMVKARERAPDGHRTLVPLVRAQEQIDECRRWAAAQGL